MNSLTVSDIAHERQQRELWKSEQSDIAEIEGEQAFLAACLSMSPIQRKQFESALVEIRAEHRRAFFRVVKS